MTDRKIAMRKRDAEKGIVRLELRCHASDRKRIKEYADRLFKMSESLAKLLRKP